MGKRNEQRWRVQHPPRSTIHQTIRYDNPSHKLPVGLSCALFAPGWIFENEFQCKYSKEYLEKEAFFWHNTLTEVNLSGQMELTTSPSCVCHFVLFQIVILICREENTELVSLFRSTPTFLLYSC